MNLRWYDGMYAYITLFFKCITYTLHNIQASRVHTPLFGTKVVLVPGEMGGRLKASTLIASSLNTA